MVLSVKGQYLIIVEILLVNTYQYILKKFCGCFVLMNISYSYGEIIHLFKNLITTFISSQTVYRMLHVINQIMYIFFLIVAGIV